MYTDYFGLREKPFELRPDPRFLYLSEGHQEALAHLKYGIMERMGFVVITGEVGTGKTTLINALLEELAPDLKKVHFTEPGSTVEDIFHPIKKALDLPVDDVSKGKFLPALHDFMKKGLPGGEPVLLIIDEAQKLSPSVLEEIRLLSNIETPGTRLFEIFLVGQQELNSMLQAPQMQQLRQRIGVKYHLKPLNLKDTQGYIRHRLEIAGFQRRPIQGEELFFPEAMKAIYRFTEGYPRLINIISDKALTAACAKNMKKVDRNIVNQVIRDVETSYEIGQKRTHFRLAWIGIAALLVTVFAYGVYKYWGILEMPAEPDTEVTTPGEIPERVVTDESQVSGVSAVRESDEVRKPEASEVLGKPVETVPLPSQEQNPEQEVQPVAVSKTVAQRLSRAAIRRSAITLGVRNREPAGRFERISVGQQRVYCWMQVVNARGEKIVVRWISNGRKIGETRLPIGSDSWRTWSYITLRPGMIGPAQAEILDENGHLLQTLSFEVTE